MFKLEPVTTIRYKYTCACSEDSNQSAHPIGVVPITQVTRLRNKKVTLKGGRFL